MNSLTLATWALVFVTLILAGSTITYTIVAYLTYKGTTKQIEALRKVTEAVLGYLNKGVQIKL